MTQRPSTNIYDVSISTNRVDTSRVHLYTNSTDQFGNITVVSSSGSPVQIQLFINGDSTSEISTTSPATAVVGTIAKNSDAVPSDTNSLAADFVVANLVLSGNLNSVSANNINFVKVGGSIQGNLTATKLPDGNRGFMGVVEATGSITGDLYAGWYMQRVKAGSTIGRTGGSQINGVGGVGALIAPTLNAHVQSQADVQSIAATSFSGSLTCRSLIQNTDPENTDVLSGVRVSGALSANIFASTDLATASAISAGTLSSQVILNSGAGSGQWLGPVTANALSLSAPEYTQRSSSIGGGAVGLAPFRLHDEDSSPANRPATPLWIGDAGRLDIPCFEVRIRHYGPVFGSGTPVVIEKWDGSAYSTDVTSRFAVHVNSAQSLAANTSSGSTPGGREIILTADGTTPPDPGVYRVRPVLGSGASNRLKCGYVTGNPVVTDYAYTFRLIACNRADVAMLGGTKVPDGTLTSDDIVAYLDSYFATDLMVADVAGLGGGEGPDGQITADDLILFLDLFENVGCNNSCDMGRAGGGGGGAMVILIPEQSAQDRITNAWWTAYNLLPAEQTALRARVMQEMMNSMFTSGQDR